MTKRQFLVPFMAKSVGNGGNILQTDHLQTILQVHRKPQGLVVPIGAKFSGIGNGRNRVTANLTQSEQEGRHHRNWKCIKYKLSCHL